MTNASFVILPGHLFTTDVSGPKLEFTKIPSLKKMPQAEDIFTIDAITGICGQQGAQHWLIALGLGVCPAAWLLPDCPTAGLLGICLPVQPMASPSRGETDREDNRGKPYRLALQKARPVFRAVTDTLSILRGLAYSALNSQMSSAPRFTQKWNRDTARL